MVLPWLFHMVVASMLAAKSVVEQRMQSTLVMCVQHRLKSLVQHIVSPKKSR